MPYLLDASLVTTSALTNTVLSTLSTPASPRECCEPTHWETTQRGETQWQVASQLEGTLLNDGGLPIESWLNNGQAEVVKHGPHRTVYRVVVGGKTFFVKHYRVPDWQAFLQNLVRQPKAILEWKAVERVRDAGIATVSRAAVGVRRRGLFAADSYLVTHAIDDVQTLHDYVAGSRNNINAGLRQTLARSLGQLIAVLHRRGLVHRDLHAGNILVRPQPDGSVRLWLIDLHAISSCRRLSAKQVADNLAMFGVFFTLRATPADRQRFFEAYWHSVRREPTAVSGWVRSRDPAALAGVEHLIEKSCAAQWQKTVDKADRKWFRGHRKLIIARNEHTHCRGIAELGEELVNAVCVQPAVLDSGERPAGEIRTSDGTSARRRWLGRTCDWTESRTIWEIGHALLRRGIPVARPLLFAETHTDGCEKDWLLTEPTSPCRGTSLSTTVVRCAAILRRLHEQRFLHQALNSESFRRMDDQIVLDGIEHVASRRRVSPQDRVEQLAALNRSDSGVSPTDRLRFLLEYLGPLHRLRWKPVWRAVAESSPPEPTAVAGTSRRGFLEAALIAGAMCLGCRTPKRPALALPARHSIHSGQMTVLSDFRLPADHTLIQDLVVLRKQVSVALKLPEQREKVLVYIFDNEKKYRDYLNRAYPGLPSRRAYFVGTPDELAVYTYWGERIQEDLRHEYTHGLLHATLRTVPLWIDEGLAEYFEVAGARPGTVNTEYAGRLAASLANGWKPDMARLERLEEFSQMQHVHYQEAWAWVHFLLHDEGTRDVLLGYVFDLRTQQRPTPLSVRLREHLPTYQDRFVAHVARIQTPQLLTVPRIQSAGRTAIWGWRSRGAFFPCPISACSRATREGRWMPGPRRRGRCWCRLLCRRLRSTRSRRRGRSHT